MYGDPISFACASTQLVSLPKIPKFFVVVLFVVFPCIMHLAADRRSKFLIIYLLMRFFINYGFRSHTFTLSFKKDLVSSIFYKSINNKIKISAFGILTPI